jgi:ferredoxin-NADP reductase
MARTAVRGRLRWQIATVDDVVVETARVRTIVLGLSEWLGHRAGQHLDVRLTAEDGYRAEREYSIASAPGDPVAITVERLDDGEVSPYLTEELRAGDEIEVRGPIGGYFVWDVEHGGPLLLVAGGSGLVPLMSMLRHRGARGSDVEAHVLVSARGGEDALYRDELEGLQPRAGLHVAWTFTRTAPAGWSGYERRVDAAMLAEVAPEPDARPLIFVCGPTPFVEAVADLLVDGGYDPRTIHAERFGPTGG